MPRKKADSATGAKIESVRHKDKRKNIPTEELRDFVKEDEKAPKRVLYTRDPSLDPQLVWKGKDEQDSKDLEVPAVPIYIQEKIHPQAIVEDVKAYAAKAQPDESMALFADFNNISFEDLIEFYQHEQNWSNRMILGDSLMVMASLAEKEGLKGKVQMIYIDPPYGIKFGSNWQVSTRKRDVKDGKAEDAVRQPEQVKAFRDTWEMGIHSYLAYLRDRLVVARELLTETGSCFVQIGVENVHLVRCIMDEVFGSDNFCGLIQFKTTGGQASQLLASVCDYLILYAKDKSHVKYRQLYRDKIGMDDVGRYQWVQSPEGVVRELSDDEIENSRNIPSNCKLLVHDNITSQGISGDSSVPYVWNGKTYNLPSNSHWKTTPNGMDLLVLADRLMAIGATLRFKRFLLDFPVSPIDVSWDDTATSGFGRKKEYVVETNAKVIERCLLMTTDPGDIVLDPTCGSGTTAYVAEQWGRRWITCDTSRVSLALARTRLMSARYPYYHLADSQEGIQKEMEVSLGRHSREGGNPESKGLDSPVKPGNDKNKSAENDKIKSAGNDKNKLVIGGFKTDNDIRKGFVYKRVPHITLKSIANNPDIKEGMSREEIDAAISRHADTEILYDQPYVDNKRLRVTGPFTVESLSPHRMLGMEENAPVSETEGRKSDTNGQFINTIIENLNKAGVQNTCKYERLKFDRLEPYAGIWIQAMGEYTEKDKTRRVAVAIGPEHGTVGSELIKEAAKEAVKGVGFDLLIVCGFAFDSSAYEKVKEFGPLTILPCRMNPDLTMGGELLKKTGSANLFMVFGEPDIDIKKKNGKITVKIKGLDIYDPTTGDIRSNKTDDIACWFLDTNYNGESFFVRHAYFTGADKPFEKLKKALRAEIDEAAWSSLYATESRPFDIPEGAKGKPGKIAIKVINHYGDEVLKVFEV